MWLIMIFFYLSVKSSEEVEPCVCLCLLMKMCRGNMWFTAFWANTLWIFFYFYTMFLRIINIIICVYACVCVPEWTKSSGKARFRWIRRFVKSCCQMETFWKTWACWVASVRWRDRFVFVSCLIFYPTSVLLIVTRLCFLVWDRWRAWT